MTTSEGFRASAQQCFERDHRLALTGDSSRPAAQLLRRIAGEPGVEDLLPRLQQLIDGNEILRTRLVRLSGGGVWVQAIDERAAAADHLCASTDSYLQVAEAAAAGAVDGSWQLHLVINGAERFLCATSDPALLDVESLRLLLDRLDPAGAGHSADDTIQYADYAEWQHELIESESADGDGGAYWDTQIAGFAEAQPFDVTHMARKRTPYAVCHTAARGLDLEAHGDWPDIRRWISGAWLGLVARLAGSDPLPCLICVAGREVDEIRDALGCYERVCPTLLPAGAGLSLADLGRAAADAAAAGASYAQELPAATVEASAVGLRFIDCGDACLQQASAPVPGAALALIVIRAGTRIALRIAFDPDVCDERFADLMLERALHCAHAAHVRPDLRLADLAVAGADELVRVRAVLGERCLGVPDPLLLPRLLHARPAQPAIASGANSLDHDVLMERAAALARVLLESGVGDAERVLLVAERGIPQLVGILGIQLARCAYVPIDPTLPIERIEAIFTDVGGASMVLDEPSAARIKLPADVRIVLSTDGECGLPADADLPLPALRPGDPAYVIFTSGSTGTPKGVVIDHGNLSASTDARIRYYPQPPRRFLLLSSFSFDSSVAGIFWTLAARGLLVVPRDGEERDLLAIADLIERHHITDTLMLSGLYDALLQSAPAEKLQSLECVIVAGEACPADLPARHRTILPNCRLYNEYGPTESTVWASVCDITDVDDGNGVPIGRCAPHVKLRVLDEQRVECGFGVAGELVILGTGLSRGYWNRPELTAQRFVQIACDGGERGYLTGDRVRLALDGELRFIGRTDDQVKIRGYRIELGEVESALAALDGVAEAAVICTGDSRELSMTGVYALAPGELASPLDIKLALHRVLPGWMVPERLEPVAAVPRNANGKVDRRALEAELRTASSVETSAQPTTTTQRQVASIWQELLGNDVTPTLASTFASLGGHSLLALRATATLEQRLGTKIDPVHLLMDNLETIAALIDQQADSTETSNAANPGWLGALTSRLQSMFGR